MEFFIYAGLALFGIVSILSTVMLRRVIPTNEVHIIQSRGKTTSYGKDTGNGNIYYEWPTWIPIIGIAKTVLPTSIFKLELVGYDSYDKERLPFEIDLVAFFRISDYNMASQRVPNSVGLNEQLTLILKGAARTTLGSYDINVIMLERSTFGDHFTKEVQEQLKQWGVETVKSIELMDIRDIEDSKVIHNIMAKAKSKIEMDSRTTVADNMKNAQIAEINAGRDAELQKQSALQDVGMRTANKDQEIGITNQRAQQAIREEERTTKEKEMAILKVAQVQQAEIDKNVNIVHAEQTKQTTVLIADGALQAKKLESEGIAIQGHAKADAEKAMLMAPVQASITLAKEIGANEGYQKYLVTIKQVEAGQVVGVEQAKALERADVKIICNSGEPIGGVTKVMDLFTAKGGTGMGAMLEGLAQTEAGKALVDKLSKAPNGHV